ncbi:MAG: undecaprenyl-diphosphate phosphatase [Eubacteriales bacterium]|jgi:undecaprenyl-diphosphatase
MTTLQAALYGLLQGLTEFLPVSSSGHLALAHSFFGVEDMETSAAAFDILLHFGTLVAVCGVYWRDIWQLILAFIGMCKDVIDHKGMRVGRDPYRRMCVMVIISILPLFVILPIQDQISGVGAYPLAVGFLLWCTAGILYLADRSKGGHKTAQSAHFLDALKVGVAQAFATLPGISRSGSTIAAGMLCGFSKEFAVKFAFIMSIPAILGANILHIGDLMQVSKGQGIPYLVGTLVAAVSGFGAIKLIDFVAKRKDFRVFSYYCAVIGAAAILGSFFVK